VPALVDTNVIVYRHDPRYPAKQRRAIELLRRGLDEGSLRIAHQVVIEFVAAVSRPIPGVGPLLAPADARREAEELLSEFPVLYPNEQVIRMALRGAAAYELSWFDAHLWAYAEYYGLEELISEDFQEGRLYGTVRAVNPFSALGAR
jgi:predicted nucleic acid-binding protein